jgi:hypothetical protein
MSEKKTQSEIGGHLRNDGGVQGEIERNFSFANKRNSMMNQMDKMNMTG